MSRNALAGKEFDMCTCIVCGTDFENGSSQKEGYCTNCLTAKTAELEERRLIDEVTDVLRKMVDVVDLTFPGGNHVIAAWEGGKAFLVLNHKQCFQSDMTPRQWVTFATLLTSIANAASSDRQMQHYWSQWNKLRKEFLKEKGD